MAAMIVFSSLEEARRHGFSWYEFNRSLELHVVVRDFLRGDGRRVRALAYAKP